MSKFFILQFIFATIICFDAGAQSITIGLQGQAKSTWLINTAVLAASVEQEAKPSFGWGGGITACMFFQQQIETYVGAGLELNFGNFVQRYSGRVSGSLTLENYNSKINMLFLDIPVYARLVLRYGTYIEAGVQFSLLTNAKYSSPGRVENTIDVTSKYSPFYYAPLLGLGADFELSDDVYLLAGIRILYGLSDLKGVDGQGNAISAAGQIPNYPDYSGSKTHAASVTLNIGVYYRLDYGKYGRSGKGRRR
ncbi:MAG: hypothetical protein POELPBGB_00024 [Bacteroidia bacterium]|nr:hypothetical protein [Bacteroidia bacterium]